MNQQAPKMKPQFILSQTVDGFHPLRKFSLKKYKLLSMLKLVKFSEEMNQNKELPLSLKLSPFLKNLKNLNLSRYYSLKNYSLSQIKLLAKRIHKITRLSLVGDNDSTNSLFLAKTMLKKAKNFSHLYLEDVLDVSSSQFQPQQLFHLISQSKLKKLNLIPIYSSKYEPKWLLNFSNYCPQTIEELSLYWKELIDGSRLKLTKNCLDNLQKLELQIPIALNTFTKVIIKAVKDPSKLKSLQLQLEKSKKNESCSYEVQEFLGNCINLEELSLKTDIDVYPNSSKINLKKLTIDSTEGLLRITDFIQQQRESLENLNLASSLWGIDLDMFLERLKSLKKLKKLKLNLKFEMSSSINALDLAKLIEALECLEEVDFTDLLVGFEDGFEEFCRALGKRDLKSLKLSMNSFKMTQKESSLFLQTLTLLSRLEHITVKDFGIEDADFYNELREIICLKNKNLNEVILDKVKREKTKGCCEGLIRMLKDVIRKPAMKELCYLEADKYGPVSDFKGLEILSLSDDILKEVHHFDSLHLPSFLCEPPSDYWDLSLYKWTEDMD